MGAAEGAGQMDSGRLKGGIRKTVMWGRGDGPTVTAAGKAAGGARQDLAREPVNPLGEGRPGRGRDLPRCPLSGWIWGQQVASHGRQGTRLCWII